MTRDPITPAMAIHIQNVEAMKGNFDMPNLYDAEWAQSEPEPTPTAWRYEWLATTLVGGFLVAVTIFAAVAK